MSFENFDFEIAQIDLLKIFDGSETMPKTGKKYGNTAREVVYDFLYDYGVRSDGIEVIETTGFTRVKLVFCHCEGIFEFFQNHRIRRVLRLCGTCGYYFTGGCREHRQGRI